MGSSSDKACAANKTFADQRVPHANARQNRQSPIRRSGVQHLSNTQNVSTTVSLDEVREVVSLKIHPHRPRLFGSAGPSEMYLASALNLGDRTLGYVRYGHDVIVVSGILAAPGSVPQNATMLRHDP